MLKRETLKRYRDNFTKDKQKNALSNAISNTNIFKACLSMNKVAGHDFTFSHSVSPEINITNQHQTGTCWIHSGLNTLRNEIQNKYNIEDFEFSQSYLAFYDKLEKCNYFLCKVIETRDFPLTDRKVEHLFKYPIQDGGQYFMFADLVSKYGLVPKDVFPDTTNSASTRNLNIMLNELLRDDGIVLRKMSKKRAQGEKEKFLEKYYELLCMTYGKPPLPEDSFTWTISKRQHQKYSADLPYEDRMVSLCRRKKEESNGKGCPVNGNGMDLSNESESSSSSSESDLEDKAMEKLEKNTKVTSRLIDRTSEQKRRVRVKEIEKQIEVLFTEIKMHLSVCDPAYKKIDGDLMKTIQKYNQQVTDIYHACYPMSESAGNGKSSQVPMMDLPEDSDLKDMQDLPERTDPTLADPSEDLGMDMPTPSVPSRPSLQSSSMSSGPSPLRPPLQSSTSSVSRPGALNLDDTVDIQLPSQSSRPSFQQSQPSSSVSQPSGPPPASTSSASPSVGSNSTASGIAGPLEQLGKLLTQPLSSDQSKCGRKSKPSFLRFIPQDCTVQEKKEVDSVKDLIVQDSIPRGCTVTGDPVAIQPLYPAIEKQDVSMTTDLMKTEGIQKLSFVKKPVSAPVRSRTNKYITPKDGNRLSFNVSPLALYNDLVPVKVDQYVTIVNDERHDSPKYSTFGVTNLGNVIESKRAIYLNLPVEEMKSYVVKSILRNKPVWFACDIEKAFYSKLSILDTEIFDTTSILGKNIFDTSSKGDRMEHCSGVANHAMVISAVDMDPVPQSQKHKHCDKCPKNECTHDLVNVKKWKVTNSWGKDSEREGYLLMTDDYFTKHAYEVAIDLSLLSKEHKKLLKMPTYKSLEPWDPLSFLAN